MLLKVIVGYSVLYIVGYNVLQCVHRVNYIAL